MLAGNLAVGRWLGRVDVRRAFAGTTALLALCWAAVFALPRATPQVVALATAAAFVAGLGWVALTTLLAAETLAALGTTLTLNGSAFALGSALGSAAGGVLIGLGGYALLSVTLPAATLVAALLVWRPRPRLRALQFSSEAEQGSSTGFAPPRVQIDRRVAAVLAPTAWGSGHAPVAFNARPASALPPGRCGQGASTRRRRIWSPSSTVAMPPSTTTVTALPACSLPTARWWAPSLI